MADIASAVRVPTPPPDGAHSPNPLKRKSPPSRSPSPERRKALRDVDPNRSRSPRAGTTPTTRRASPPPPAKVLTEAEKQEMARKEYAMLLEKSRSGGVYIPPARLRALQAELPDDKNSKEYQRIAWDALKKSINGLINKANTGNLRLIIPELFQENLVRGRGLFVNSILRAQASSVSYSAMFASLSAIITSKLPEVGQLLVNRLASRFQKAFRRNDKAVALTSSHFIAHLTNQMVVNENLVMQMLLLLLQQPTDDSVEMAVALSREVGAFLEEHNRQLADLIFTQLRQVLQSSEVDKRVLYSIEVLMQDRKNRWKNNPVIPEGLDLIEDDDKFTLEAPPLDAPIDVETSLNIFKFDPDYEQSEARWVRTRSEVLGEDGADDDEEDEDESDEDEESEGEREEEIKDMTAEELTRLRRKIYLTIQSTSNFEEACHKLVKLQMPAGKERELSSMIIETCSQRPTYEKFYGLIGERLCEISRFLQSQFEEEFVEKYTTIHRFETPRLRSIASFFAHLIGTSAIGWHVLSAVTLTEAGTSSASRIFIKILFQGIVEEIGTPKLNEKLRDPLMQPNFTGLFPKDHPLNTRFAINYFTSIGMGAITEDLREYLINVPQPTLPAAPSAARGRTRSGSVSSYSSYSSYSSRSRSRSRSYSSRSRSRGRSDSRSPPPRRGRDRSSRSRSESESRSRTPPPRRRRRSDSRSRSPSRSRSRSLSDSSSPAPRGSRHRSPSRSPSRLVTPPRRAPPPRRRGHSSSDSRSISLSRSPPRRRRYSDSRSRSSPPRRAPARRGRATSLSSSSVSRSPSRSRSRPPPSKNSRLRGSPSPPARRPPPPPPAPKERSLSPYSRRVALTRGQNGPPRR